jgi:hypothetical protein
MFPAREPVHHDAWVEASYGNFSGIYITGYAGSLGRADVEVARDAAVLDGRGRRGDIGPMEILTIDGRTAWGWGEEWRLQNGGLQYVVFRAAIPYDTITYVVDFLTGDPSLKSRPDSLRTVVASFAVGRTRPNVPLLLISCGLFLFLLNAFVSKRRSAAARARHIPLARIPKKPGAGDPSSPAPAKAPPPLASAADNAPPSIADAIRGRLGSAKPRSGS